MDFEEESRPEEAASVENEKSWDDIIPETERKNLEAEEEQQKQLELYLPKRPRKSVKKVTNVFGYFINCVAITLKAFFHNYARKREMYREGIT